MERHPTDPRTSVVIGAAIEVHRALGPGLLESAYEACLIAELSERGIAAASQVPVAVRYKGQSIDVGYRLDLVVDDAVVVELKSVDRIHRIHVAQLLTYMRLGTYRTGLILNFNVPRLKDGIVRLVL